MWLIAALSCAFFTATSAAITKLLLRRNDEYLIGWLRLVVSIPFLLVILFSHKIPHLDGVFVRTVIIMLPLEVVAYMLFLKAIKHSPLSLTLPFLALTPVFLVLTGHLILGERIGSLGLVGIVFVALGGYLLHANTLRMGIFKPLTSIFKEKGSVYMIIVATIFSVTAALAKVAINHSSALFFGIAYFPLVAVVLFPIVIVRYRRGLIDLNNLKGEGRLLILLGIIFASAILTHCLSISMAKVAYVVSVKRLSMIFGVIYGWLIFKESHILSRLLGTALMVFGVILIALS